MQHRVRDVGLILSIFLLAVAMWTGSSAVAEDTENPEGFWEGEIIYRGDALPLRLEIKNEADGVHAYMDLPSLVLQHRELPYKAAGTDGFDLEFPFGIGTFSFQLADPDTLIGHDDDETTDINLRRGLAPSVQSVELEFGSFKPNIAGTLYLPEGDGPFATIILIGGSGSAARQQWSYASWADYYVRQGFAAFIYDRRPDLTEMPDGRIANIADHAQDLLSAIAQIKAIDSIGPSRIGAKGSSRGAWIAVALADISADISFLVLSSPAIATPAEQEVDRSIAGMRLDGLSSADLNATRNFLRLYFYVARTGVGWDLLEAAMQEGSGSNWLQYLSQPRTPEDLSWWRANMDFDMRSHLQRLKIPVLIFWGGGDFITPWFEYRDRLQADLALAGNNDVTVGILEGADHRLEMKSRVDEAGNWRWFGISPAFFEVSENWMERFRANSD